MLHQLRTIGPIERPDHPLLPVDAQCHFFIEYTPSKFANGLRWDFSPGNRLIGDFKLNPQDSALPDWPAKESATKRISQAFANALCSLGPDRLQQAVLVPMPPSKGRADPAYDPRMLAMLHGVERAMTFSLDIRDCLSFSGRNQASHEVVDRPTPDALFADLNYDVQAGHGHISGNRPSVIYLFDDILTFGAHYVAAARLLEIHFPGVPVVGMFVARSILVAREMAEFNLTQYDSGTSHPQIINSLVC